MEEREKKKSQKKECKERFEDEIKRVNQAKMEPRRTNGGRNRESYELQEKVIRKGKKKSEIKINQ